MRAAVALAVRSAGSGKADVALGVCDRRPDGDEPDVAPGGGAADASVTAPPSVATSRSPGRAAGGAERARAEPEHQVITGMGVARREAVREERIETWIAGDERFALDSDVVSVGESESATSA